MATRSFIEDIKIKSRKSVERLEKVIQSDPKPHPISGNSRDIDRRLKEGAKILAKYFSRLKTS